MVNEAKSHEAEDREKRHKIDARNNADALVFQTEKNLKEYGEKLDADTRAKVEAAVERVREALKSDNTNEIQSSVDALNQVWQAAATAMYQSAAGGSRGAPGSQAGGDPASGSAAEGKAKTEDKTVDADFEVVDD